MSAAGNLRRVSALTYNGSLTEPVGARFTTRTTIKANKPGIIITDECLAIEDIQHEFEFRFQGIVAPPTAGYSGSAVAVCQSFTNATGGGGSGGGGLTITLPTSLFTESEIDANSDPVVQTIRGRYVGTALQPMTVA